MIDIYKYLDRIGLQAIPTANLDGLRSLQSAHLYHVPFENLEIHYGRQIVLDPARLYDKVVGQRRGGFCYELNGLFKQLLAKIGFKVAYLSARVYGADEQYGHEFDHMALLVQIGAAEYLVDVGFGAFTMGPLRFVTDLKQQDPNGLFEIRQQEAAYFRVDHWVNGVAKPQYIFKKEIHPMKAFEGMCRYHQTDPASHFTQKKMISRPTHDGRITLSSTELKINTKGIIHTTAIEDTASFERYLLQYFDIDMHQ